MAFLSDGFFAADSCHCFHPFLLEFLLDIAFILLQNAISFASSLPSECTCWSNPTTAAKPASKNQIFFLWRALGSAAEQRWHIYWEAIQRVSTVTPGILKYEAPAASNPLDGFDLEDVMTNKYVIDQAGMDAYLAVHQRPTAPAPNPPLTTIATTTTPAAVGSHLYYHPCNFCFYCTHNYRCAHCCPNNHHHRCTSK